MRRTALWMTLLACLLLPTVLLAHEGHRHDARGTIETIEEGQIALVTVDGAKEVFMLSEETSFSRGEEVASLEEVDAGERAVLIYQKKNSHNIAIEVKLGPKAK